MRTWRIPFAATGVVFILVQVCLPLLLVEVGLRALRPWHRGLRTLLYLPTVRTQYADVAHTSELLKSTVLGFSPGRETGGFVLNSQGFRTREYTYERGPGLRIVALGDSFTYGTVPFDHGWPSRLEALLGERPAGDQGVEVISLGVPAVGPEFYLRLWQLEGVRLRPDLAVLGFFVGNDILEEGDRLLDTPRASLIEHSLLARAMRNAWRLLRAGRLASRALPEDRFRDPRSPPGTEVTDFANGFDPLRPTIPEDVFLNLEWTRLAICRLEDRDRLHSHLRRVRSILQELDRAVRASGAQLVVLLIPDEFQVDDGLLERLLLDRAYPASQITLRYPQRRLAEFFDKQGIHHVDALPTLRERTRSGRVYRVNDTHWNAAGNEVGAQLVVDYLVSSGLASADR